MIINIFFQDLVCGFHINSLQRSAAIRRHGGTVVCRSDDGGGGCCRSAKPYVYHRTHGQSRVFCRRQRSCTPRNRVARADDAEHQRVFCEWRARRSPSRVQIGPQMVALEQPARCGRCDRHGFKQPRRNGTTCGEPNVVVELVWRRYPLCLHATGATLSAARLRGVVAAFRAAKSVGRARIAAFRAAGEAALKKCTAAGVLCLGRVCAGGAAGGARSSACVKRVDARRGPHCIGHHSARPPLDFVAVSALESTTPIIYNRLHRTFRRCSRRSVAASDPSRGLVGHRRRTAQTLTSPRHLQRSFFSNPPK